jgi:hypothetical protein
VRGGDLQIPGVLLESLVADWGHCKRERNFVMRLLGGYSVGIMVWVLCMDIVQSFGTTALYGRHHLLAGAQLYDVYHITDYSNCLFEDLAIALCN